MAIFNRNVKAAIAGVGERKAAAAGSNIGSGQIGNFAAYTDGVLRARAMSLPVVKRSRDLVCTTIGNMRFEMYREMWNGTDMEAVPLAPRAWLSRIDKSVTNNHILSWTTDDLIFIGRAFWAITERTSDGYPSNFTRLPAAMCSTIDQAGGVWFGPSNQILFNGMKLDSADIVQFIGPSQGLNYTSRRAVETAIRIEESRIRNAESSLPAGILRQISGEPLSASELQDLGASFNLARATNQTAVLNEHVTYTETTALPDNMLMIESADYSAKDLSRALGVPPYLVGVSTGSYAYTNATQSRIDLWTFGCLPLAECISQTLSSDNVLPHGTAIKFDVDQFITENYLGNDIDKPVENIPDMARQ